MARQRCQRANENLGTFPFQRQLAGRRTPASLSLFHDAEIKAQGAAGTNSQWSCLFSRKRPPMPLVWSAASPKSSEAA
jgi:hypothetical protein